MKIANYISWGLLALALIAAGYYWWSRRNPAGYFGSASTNYKLGFNDHLNLYNPRKWGSYVDNWDGTVTRGDGKVVKKADLYFERIKNKIKPDMAYLQVPSSILNDDMFNQYVQSFYKGADIEMTGLETGDSGFTTALANYLKSGKIAYGPELVTVGQFIDQSTNSDIDTDAADGFIQVENLGGDAVDGFGYTGEIAVDYNVKPDGTLCPTGEGWCENAGICVPIGNNSINVRNGVIGYFTNSGSSNSTWEACTNLQRGA